MCPITRDSYSEEGKNVLTVTRGMAVELPLKLLLWTLHNSPDADTIPESFAFCNIYCDPTFVYTLLVYIPSA